jgi:hypothetical protein
MDIEKILYLLNTGNVPFKYTRNCAAVLFMKGKKPEGAGFMGIRALGGRFKHKLSQSTAEKKLAQR